MIRRAEQGVAFDSTEKVHWPFPVALGLDRQDALRHRPNGRLLEGCVAEEGVDPSQPGIPAARGVAAFLLQVIEKAQYEGRIQILCGQLGGTFVQAPLSIRNQQAKGITIVRDGMRAGVAFLHQAFRKVGLEQFGKGQLGLHFPPFSALSQRRVANSRSSGTAERYQYVSLT